MLLILLSFSVFPSQDKNSISQSSEDQNKIDAIKNSATEEIDSIRNVSDKRESAVNDNGVGLDNIIDTDYSTLKEDLLKSDIIQDLPKNGIINLRFYNFNTGERQLERSYVLKKDSVEEGTESGDIQIIIHSKYVDDFKTKDACEVLTDAKNNGDFGADTEMTDSALIWKYKSMMKYKDCLGL